MATTTRKFFVKAAKIVAEKYAEGARLRELTGEQYKIGIAQELENAFVELFRGDNPQFDESRFRAACKGK